MAFVIPSIFTAIDKMSMPLKVMGRSVGSLAERAETVSAKINRSLNKISNKAFQIGQVTGVAGAAIVAPLGLAVNQAIKFEDRMADISKTTGLQGAELAAFGKGIREMSHTTRTSIEDLSTIGEIGGRLGVAKAELLSFTKASDKFAIALAEDYSGGVEEAITSVSKLAGLFNETRKIPIAEAITKTGSVINELGGHGFGTSQNINNFMLRMGALPDAIKPAMTDIAALGGFLEKSGIDAQIGSGGLTNFFLVANKNLGGFAAQMHIGRDAAAELFKQDPTEFAKRFASSLQGMSADQLATKLQSLGIGTQETIKVLGTLSGGLEQLTAIQNLSSQAFANGTSLSDEAAKKNETLAAKIEKAKNIGADLAITIGEKLVPAISKFMDKVTPIVTSISDWMNKHQELTSIIVTGLGVFGTASLLISGISGAIGLITKATTIWNIAQKILNGTMKANPIGIVITIIGLLVTAILWLVDNVKGWGDQWDEILNWMKNVLKLYVLGVKIYFMSIANAFLFMVDEIVLAWKKGMNLIGKISDEQYAKDKARIEEQRKLRSKAYADTLNEAKDLASKVIQGPAWKLQWDKGDEQQKTALAPAASTPSVDRKLAERESFSQSLQKIVSTSRVQLDINNNSSNDIKVASSPQGMPIKMSPTIQGFKKRY